MSVEEVELLRLYIDDRKDGTEKFNDTQLQDFIDNASGDLHIAAVEVWSIKAANVSDYYLVNVDGTFLSRNQIFDHCMAMVDFHRANAGGTGAFTTMQSVQLATSDVSSDSSSEF